MTGIEPAYSAWAVRDGEAGCHDPHGSGGVGEADRAFHRRRARLVEVDVTMTVRGDEQVVGRPGEVAEVVRRCHLPVCVDVVDLGLEEADTTSVPSGNQPSPEACSTSASTATSPLSPTEHTRPAGPSLNQSRSLCHRGPSP